MTIQQYLNEEIINPEFSVWISNKVYAYIDKIHACNIWNDDALRNFDDSFSLIQEHLSYRSVALGYANSVKEIANRALCIDELGISVHYMMKFSETYGNYSVSIYKIIVDFNNFGLNNPSKIRRRLQEKVNRITMKESQLRSIIRESLKKILNI